MAAHATRASAQSDPRAVQPERPTVATHAGTVAPGFLEIETGGEWDRYSDQSRGWLIPTVFKLGLSPHAQLSVFAPVVHPPGAGRLGVGDLAVGVKWRWTDDHPLLGRFAVLPSVKLPTGSMTSGAGTGTTDVGLLLISSHDIGPVALDINAGYTRRSGDGSAAPRDATVWTISTGGPAIGSFGWVAEVFGYPRTTGIAGQPSVVEALFGPTLSACTWLAVDAGVMVPITGSPPRALYAGGVWNVGRLF
jgi:hypothetical protein